MAMVSHILRICTVSFSGCNDIYSRNAQVWPIPLLSLLKSLSGVIICFFVLFGRCWILKGMACEAKKSLAWFRPKASLQQIEDEIEKVFKTYSYTNKKRTKATLIIKMFLG